jgi:hypothetical protein
VSQGPQGRPKDRILKSGFCADRRWWAQPNNTVAGSVRLNVYDREPERDAFLASGEEPWRPFWGLRYNLTGGRKVEKPHPLW